MAGLFPFFGDTAAEQSADNPPLYKEVAWDFENNIPVLEKGDFRIVTGNEAIKTWVYKTLKTERFRYLIYTWDYGSELDDLIGKNYTPNLTKAECIRYIREALLVNPYIRNVSDIAVTFDAGRLFVTGSLDTVYGKEGFAANV